MARRVMAAGQGAVQQSGSQVQRTRRLACAPGAFNALVAISIAAAIVVSALEMERPPLASIPEAAAPSADPDPSDSQGLPGHHVAFGEGMGDNDGYGGLAGLLAGQGILGFEGSMYPAVSPDHEFAPPEPQGLVPRSSVPEAADQPAGLVSEGTSSEEDAIPRVRRCIGNPARQIEDPQSPPCVSSWSGDNGGATAEGVTADSILVYHNLDTGSDEFRSDRLVSAFESFLNARFEFYGRRLRLEYRNFGGGKKDQSDAAAVATGQAFAVVSDGISIVHPESFAGAGTVHIGDAILESNAFLQQHGPYLWQYPMGLDDQHEMFSAWMCQKLVGKTAQHAGDAVEQLTDKTRKFGLLYVRYGNQERPPASSADGLADSFDRSFRNRCGGDGFAVIQTPFWYLKGDASNLAEPGDVIDRFIDEEVTSIACFCEDADLQIFGAAATQRGYYPEWLVGSYLRIDDNHRVTPSDQAAHRFGLSFRPKQIPPTDHPVVWATQEVDPEYRWWETEPGETQHAASHYRQFLLLASGIQMAGPHLTPESFAAALQQTRFPNPQHPIMAGEVGFGPGRHGMTRDAAEIWWSNHARDPLTGKPGAYCYVNGGTRHSFDWAGADRFFQEPCDSGSR